MSTATSPSFLKSGWTDAVATAVPTVNPNATAGHRAHLAAVLQDRLAVAGDGARAEAQAHEAVRRRFLQRRQRVAPDEVALVELHRPAEATAVRVGVVVHVLAVQAQARLQPQACRARRARPAPTRAQRRPPAAHPRAARALRVDVDLEAVLARVPGARDALDTCVGDAREREAGREERRELAQRRRALVHARQRLDDVDGPWALDAISASASLMSVISTSPSACSVIHATSFSRVDALTTMTKWLPSADLMTMTSSTMPPLLVAHHRVQQLVGHQAADVVGHQSLHERPPRRGR